MDSFTHHWIMTSMNAWRVSSKSLKYTWMYNLMNLKYIMKHMNFISSIAS